MVRAAKISFIILSLILTNLTSASAGESYVGSSCLATGKWFKIAVLKDGIYRIDFSKLVEIGLENPFNPRIFGNNCGQLSYFNDGTEPDDLRELAIYTYTGSDGVFNEGDYLLFYGQSPHRWTFDSATGEYDFLRHNYSDTAFYFITSGSAPGKRIGNASEPSDLPNYVTGTSDALFIHEFDRENIIHSGREWFQPISSSTEVEIIPAFKDLVPGENIKYTLRVLARSSSSTLFRLSENGSVISSIQVEGVNISSTTGTYARIASDEGEFLPASQDPDLKIAFRNNGDPAARGWIDYLRLAARRHNRFDGTEIFLSDTRSVGQGRITEFKTETASQGVNIWDITDPHLVKSIGFRKTGDEVTFKEYTDSLKRFLVFTVSNAIYPVIQSEPIENQNLHGSGTADMVIVTHPLFRKYAEDLAGLHAGNSGLRCLIVTPGQIYNEFSGGIPDGVAIRNFMRMKYVIQKGSSVPLKYLLLFGDGSFDNKTPVPLNTSFIPTYQTLNSNITISSFTSDDFFGLLDDGEGEEAGTEDIGIGRIPVSDTVSARHVISKIEKYLSPSNQGEWKNIVCLTADDEDGNTHMSDAEGLASLIKENFPWINTDKIYFDANQQVTTSTGQFYPDVTTAINDRINNGVLVFNYIGHGNETSLGHERVVTPESIDEWKNIEKLPLFITATCEFSRFDDVLPNSATGILEPKNSSGEKILLDDNGGAVGLMSTTRLVYSAPNYTLNRNILAVAFSRDKDGKAMRLGDIIRIAKNRTGNNTNKRNFILLGDPAVRLSWPWYGNVITDSLKLMPSGEICDTLQALSTVSVSGHIEDTAGNLLNSFNGMIAPVVFGQESQIQTLANDGGPKMVFNVRKNILFRGTTSAANGRFEFSFIVPRDIDYSYGTGKISYYANDEFNDMNGSFSNFIIGGFSDSETSDTRGPEISLFMNDTLFRDGGMTDSEPKLLALIEDQSGINTSGSGIGHDIICWLDGDRSNQIILNNYYVNDYGNYNRGRIQYMLSGLSAGEHYLTIKVWDNYNNSAEKSIKFNVVNEDKFILRNLLNYPNPFRNTTKISAEHNRPDDMFNIRIEIFSMNGNIVRIIETDEPSTGFQLAPVEWDGSLQDGQKVARGAYPYRLTISTEKGESSTISGIMIIY